MMGKKCYRGLKSKFSQFLRPLLVRKYAMLKTLLTSVLLILIITNCHKEIATDNYNYPNDTPEWLQTKIDSIATIKYYALTKVYTYKWKEKYLILNPSPSKGEGLLNSLSLRRRGNTRVRSD